MSNANLINWAAEEGANPLIPHTAELIVGFIAFSLLFLVLRSKVVPLFEKAFGSKDVTVGRIAKAIAQFVRTLITADSKFDQWRRGETNLTDDEFAGYEMFLREGGDPETTPGGQFGGDVRPCVPRF